MQRFWLNYAVELEASIYDRLEVLKPMRKYSAAIRDGLTLLFSLEDGRTDTLFRMFPWIVDELKPKTIVTSGGGGDNSKLAERLDRLEQALLQQSVGQIMNQARDLTASIPPSINTPKALNVPKFDLPTIDLDDDDFTLDIKTDTSKKNVSQNFADSILSL